MLNEGAAAALDDTGLPRQLKAGVEALSGVSLNHVRVHRNSPRPAMLQAHAYAAGGEIHLASGQERHLPHEAWHAAQQAQGRVRATTQLKAGAPLNDDPALEAEADRMGVRAVATPAALLPPAAAATGPAAVQRCSFAARRPIAPSRTSSWAGAPAPARWSGGW